jgi:hypothetical protein
MLNTSAGGSGTTGVGPHVWVVVLQIGFVAGQLELSAHWMHCLVAGSQTGVAPEQSEALEHSFTQVPVGLQIGVGGAQFLFSPHWTHCLLAGLQIGVEPEQSEFFVHSWTHLPVAASQVGVAGGHCELSAHWTHFLVVGLQIGAVFGHSELFAQSVPHVPVVVLQIGVVAGHCVLSAHWTQRFVVGLQIGDVFGHWELAVHSAVQLCVVGLQTGAEAGHSAPDLHCTHVFEGSSQSGFEPTQSCDLAVVHSTHRPSGSLQTGLAPEQLASLVHPLVQVWFVGLQTPFEPVHCVLSLHSTQRFTELSQTGFVPVHRFARAVVHSTHFPVLVPVVAQAGAVSVLHALAVPELRSPSHGTQVPAALQIGVAPPHWPSLLHSTHVWVVSLQAGFVPVQRSLFPFVHWTHIPMSVPLMMQAGTTGSLQRFGEPEFRSPSQGMHVPPEQTGVVPPHWASVTHWTHLFVVVSHCGFGPGQSLKSRHSTHVEIDGLQRGTGAKQFASVTQPGVHSLFRQMPKSPLQ